MLWGRFAQQKEYLLTPNKHLILKAAHPSPFSAHQGFFGCAHFSKANAYLSAQGVEPIHWDPDFESNQH
jgi:uracil-DNA glycosylase